MQSSYRGSVRCIYIDPPYNNQETYTHYVDQQSHDDWIGALKPRLKLLFPLLSEDGSLWVSIDDRELHYLKVVCDTLFGRDRFIATIVWQHRKSRENRRVFSNNHEYILVYARNPEVFAARRNLLPESPELLARHRNPDDDPRGAWQSVSANAQDGHATPQQYYEIIAPNGRRHLPPRGRCWVYPKRRMMKELKQNNIWFGEDGNGVPRLKKFLKDARLGLTPPTLWSAEDVGTTRAAKRHMLDLITDHEPFDTPKPEPLLRRIIEVATNPGDLVLDSYLGSGTTAAVAHKLGRRYIGVEIGRHAVTHCVQRLRAVIAGEQGGVSAEVGWKGGGGFSFVEHQSVRTARLASA
jgi:adenine-specific DNA-methyltransferase